MPAHKRSCFAEQRWAQVHQAVLICNSELTVASVALAWGLSQHFIPGTDMYCSLQEAASAGISLQVAAVIKRVFLNWCT